MPPKAALTAEQKGKVGRLTVVMDRYIGNRTEFGEYLRDALKEHKVDLNVTVTFSADEVDDDDNIDGDSVQPFDAFKLAMAPSASDTASNDKSVTRKAFAVATAKELAPRLGKLQGTHALIIVVVQFADKVPGQEATGSMVTTFSGAVFRML